MADWSTELERDAARIVDRDFGAADLLGEERDAFAAICADCADRGGNAADAAIGFLMNAINTRSHDLDLSTFFTDATAAAEAMAGETRLEDTRIAIAQIRDMSGVGDDPVSDLNAEERAEQLREKGED